MSRLTATAILGFVLATLGTLAATAQQSSPPKRVALIIGNDKYTTLAELKNPVCDAKAVAFLLQRHGFEVTLLTDLNRDGFE